MVNQALVDDIVRKIVERFHPRRIVLFGSLARGQGGPASDIDLFIEMSSDKIPPERAIEIDQIFGLRNWAMDLIVYTPEEVQKLRGIHGTLLATIEQEGKTLYEQPSK
jgi:predicted nucleotidyltransferase